MPFYKPSDAKTFYAKISRDRLFENAASLTYTSILSLIPMMAMAYAFFAAFGGFDKYDAQISDLIANNLAPAFADRVQDYIDSIGSKLSADALGIFGVLGFLWTSTSMLGKTENALNGIWGAPNRRSFLHRVINYWTLLSLGLVIAAASIAVYSSAFAWLEADHGDVAKVLVYVLTYLGPYALNAFLFFAIYKLLPRANIHRSDAWKAAAIAGLIFEIAKQAYAVYAAYAVKHNVYGSLAILPVFFLWVYWVWMITLLGFEYCCYLESQRMGWVYTDVEETLDTLLLLDILELLGKYQSEGKGVALKDLVHVLQTSRRAVLFHLNFLKQQKIIVEEDSESSKEEIYHLAYSRDSMNQKKMLEALEKTRFKPVGPATRAFAEKQFQLFSDWHLS